MFAKKKPISELKEGDRVEDIFIVKIKKGVSPYANGFRFQLIVSDASGKSIDYVYWGGTEEGEVRRIYDSIKADDVVFIQGRCEIFNNRPKISTNPPDIIRVLQKGEYNPEDFVKPPRRPIEEMVSELYGYINSINNFEVRRLLQRVFIEDRDFMEKFKYHPGAIEIHHNWIGGLLQHTLEVAKYCDLSSKLFPELDRDILMAGALLHDIGKMEEITVTTRIKATRKGQLKGHIAIGYKMLSDIMDELKISEDIRDKILHIVLSHHGFMEFGSPKEPMFSEALVVYYADEISSKTSEIIEFIKEKKKEQEAEKLVENTTTE